MPQDRVREPRIRVRLLVAFVRLLAGRRGFASVSWREAGFTCTLRVVRDPDGPDAVTFDADPDAIDADLIRGRARDALRFYP